MGHNIDFCEMLGLPKTVVCPRCRQEIDSNLDDYDIDSHEVKPTEHGVIRYSMYCCACGHDWVYSIRVWATPATECPECTVLRARVAGLEIALEGGSMCLKWFVLCDEWGNKTEPELHVWDAELKVWMPVEGEECKSWEWAEVQARGPE